MTNRFRASTIGLAVALGWALPTHAQSADAEQVTRELAAMRAQMDRMAERIDTLEAQLAVARANAEAARASASRTAPATAVAAPASTTPASEVTWDGAPKLSSKDGWSFKPRGRLQMDIAGVDAPGGIASGNRLGVGTELRRAYMGFDGTIPGGFGYRMEADFANSGVELTDLYLTYKPSRDLTLTVGQHKPFWGLEEMTSDIFTTFMERAAFSSAFGFERRVGLSASYAGKAVLVQGGVFTDNAKDLDDTNNSYSIHGRVVVTPRLAGGQLHLGASAYVRDFNDLANEASYGARPFVHTTDLRLVSTGKLLPVTGERGIGAEAAYIRGRFHATTESHWLTVKRPGLPDPTFNGGYAEAGYFLTDDATAYKGGVFDRTRPKHPVGEGGFGALQLNVRYDWLDLVDAGVIGGRQQIAGLSLVWIPVDYVRLIANYGHVWVKDAAVPAGTDRDYAADVLGMRAQVDF